MSYTLQANKSDTLNGGITNVATSATLTTGNFGSPSGTQLLVLDYDNGSFEIVSCTIAGTALTSLIRGVDNTTGVTHSSGAKVLMAFCPTHYSNGLGALAAADPWTSWTPTFSASGSMTFTGTAITIATYQQIGKTINFRLKFSGTTGGTASTSVRFTLPVTAKDVACVFSAQINEASGNIGNAVLNSTTVCDVFRSDAANWSLSAGRILIVAGVYEAL